MKTRVAATTPVGGVLVFLGDIQLSRQPKIWCCGTRAATALGASMIEPQGTLTLRIPWPGHNFGALHFR
jgi:hypothetical protein